MTGKAGIDLPLRADERMAKLVWPDLQETFAPDLHRDDCLLVCAGFEERCLGSLKRAGDAGKHGFTTGIVRYLPHYPQNRIQEIRLLAKRLSSDQYEFTYDRENPAGIGSVICNFSYNFSRIFVDISGMSRLLIVQILQELVVLNEPEITLIYGEAVTYPPTEELVNKNIGEESQSVSYLSSGIFEIAATPELASIAMLGEPIRLIAFPSFDPAQLTNLIQELQPTYGDFVHGIPPDLRNKWRTEAIRRINRPSLDHFSKKRHHQSSTIDYRETIKLVLDIYAERSVFDRLVIAPTGSKMQTVGVGLLRAVLSDIQIVYPTPQIFIAPTEHTIGLRRLFELKVPIRELREVLAS